MRTLCSRDFTAVPPPLAAKRRTTLVRIPIGYGGEEHSLCPYYPGYRFWWPGVDDALADNVIGLLGFMDRFA